MNKVFCELCNAHVHKNSVWKNIKSDKSKKNLRYD